MHKKKTAPFKCANWSYLRLTALHQLDEVSKEDVPVSLTETLGIVRHLEGDAQIYVYQRGESEAFKTFGKLDGDTCVKVKTGNHVLTKINNLNFTRETNKMIQDPYKPPNCKSICFFCSTVG